LWIVKILKNKQFWGAIIGLALLIYCVKDIRLSELKILLSSLNYYFLIPSVSCSFLYVAIKAARWRMLMVHPNGLSFSKVFSLYGAGLVLTTAMPALTGQVARLILFSRKLKMRKSFVFSTLFLEILFDSVSLIIFIVITSLAFVFPSEYRSLSYIITGATASAVVALYLILQYQEKLERLCLRLLRNRRPGIYIAIKKFIRSFAKGIRLLRSSQHLFGTLTVSLLSWFTHLLVVYFLFKSFAFDLPFAAAAVLMVINTLVLMIPITPGNAGMFEFAVTTSLAAFSIGRSDAVMFALSLHLIDLLPIFIFGGWYLRTQKNTTGVAESGHTSEHSLTSSLAAPAVTSPKERA